MTAIRFANARLIHSNFEGRAGQFHREGDRTVCILIKNEDMVKNLRAAKLNVIELNKAGEWFLPVKINTEEAEIEIKDESGTLIPEEDWPLLDRYRINGDVFIVPKAWAYGSTVGVMGLLVGLDVLYSETHDV